MKAIVTIEITDKTSEEKLNKYGFNRDLMAYHYRRAFTQLVELAMHPGCEAAISCVVTDNTKGE